jgi:hypothetical protein
VARAFASISEAWPLGIFENKWVLRGLVFVNVLPIAVIDTAPMNRLFHTMPVPLADLSHVGAIASVARRIAHD